MKLYPNSKVYIICGGNNYTGGVESCHQLCSTLTKFGINSFMVYVHDNIHPLNNEDPVHDFCKKYHLPWTLSWEDAPHNILILPEVGTNVAFNGKIQRVIWWLSVDNYMETLIYHLNESLRKKIFDREPLTKDFFFGGNYDNLEHFVQSEYARQFLKINGVFDDKIHMVEDYLNQAFLNRTLNIDLFAKKNIVVYNPKKGFEITKHLIAVAPDIDWRPVRNMTPAQVQELLAEAKIYIDFGHYPGKDRLPREATLSGCVVITGKRGAAANDIDINIPAEFKFDMTATPVQVTEKIRETFNDFSSAYSKQKVFRDREFNAQKIFEEEVIKAFGIKNLPLPTVAFTQGVSEKSFLLVQELFKSKNFTPNFIVDDTLAGDEFSDKIILREQNRNYLRVGKNLVEIITRNDAKFLYWEGRIKKFALFEPTDSELDELKNFYEPNFENVLIFSR